jgi:hypothetical protein
LSLFSSLFYGAHTRFSICFVQEEGEIALQEEIARKAGEETRSVRIQEIENFHEALQEYKESAYG